MKTKSQYRRDFAANRTKAEQWQKEVRRRLEQMLGVGSRHALPGGNPLGRWTGAAGEGATAARGGIDFQSGVSPTDQQVAQYIQMLGGNPYINKMQRAQQGLNVVRAKNTGATPGVKQEVSKQIVRNLGIGKTTSGKPAKIPSPQELMKLRAKQEKKEEKSLLDQFLADAQSKYEEANKANEDRYQDILGRLEGSRERNLERVENYGTAASADLEERAAETLGATQANLSARGLGNSTIFDAFRQRNARDLAREQQRLSEQVDSRTAEYDQRLTGDIAGFMERRTDQAPNYGQLATLAQQYGLSGDGQGFTPAAEEAPVPVAPQRVGYQPPADKAMNRMTGSVIPQQVTQQVPQQSFPVYQAPQGLSARAAGALARNVQGQLGNYSGFGFQGIGWSSPGASQGGQFGNAAEPSINQIMDWRAEKDNQKYKPTGVVPRLENNPLLTTGEGTGEYAPYYRNAPSPAAPAGGNLTPTPQGDMDYYRNWFEERKNYPLHPSHPDYTRAPTPQPMPQFPPSTSDYMPDGLYPLPTYPQYVAPRQQFRSSTSDSFIPGA